MAEHEEKKDTAPGNEEKSQEEHSEEAKSILPEPGKARIKRRNFIGKMLIGCGVAAGAEVGYAGFKLMAEKPVAEKTPVVLNLSQLPMNSRTTVLYGGEKVEVIRTEKGIKALSMVCTHLGCLVIWQEDERVYHCPCHDAYFTEDGEVISGPPTQPLEQIPVTVSGNTVTIGG